MKRLYMALSAGETQESLIGSLWRYFYDTYLNPTEYYEHLGIDGSGILSVRLIIFGLCVGVIVAMFAAVYNKRTLGNIVRKFLAAEALSPESALTLEEIGLEGSMIARYAVCKSVNLRRVLKCREEQEFEQGQLEARKEHEQNRASGKTSKKFRTAEYRVNPYADAFFIPEDMKYMADAKFEKKGTSLAGAFIFTAVIFVAFIAIMLALPSLLEFIDGIVGNFSS